MEFRIVDRSVGPAEAYDTRNVDNAVPPGAYSHIDADTLELYALGRITDESALGAIEEHLLVCAACQDRLNAEDVFVRTLRVAHEHLGWAFVHHTPDGEIKLFVYQDADGKYVGRITGGGVDCGTWRESNADAQTWCEGSFRQMFPEHQCGPECRIGNVRA